VSGVKLNVTSIGNVVLSANTLLKTAHTEKPETPSAPFADKFSKFTLGSTVHAKMTKSIYK